MAKRMYGVVSWPGVVACESASMSRSTERRVSCVPGLSSAIVETVGDWGRSGK